MKKFFIGVDVSKDTLDLAVVDHENSLLFSNEQYPNSKQGIGDFIKWIKASFSSQMWVCMEHTGHYGYLLAGLLSQANIPYSLINPLEIKYSSGIVRGKTDATDAIMIARYAASHSFKLQAFHLPCVALQKLKVLLNTRDRYVKIRTQLKNGVKALLIVEKTLPVGSQINEQKKLIRQMDESIKKCEKEMQNIIKTEKSLLHTYNKISKITGVGPITSIKCIAETANFVRFTNGRKFCCHSGLAPFKYESGTSVKGKTRTSPRRDRSLKNILFKAASSAIQHDQQLKAYYNRKRKEGKHKLTVLNAVASKLVMRIFAVAQREEPYVKLSA